MRVSMQKSGKIQIFRRKSGENTRIYGEEIVHNEEINKYESFLRIAKAFPAGRRRIVQIDEIANHHTSRFKNI